MWFLRRACHACDYYRVWPEQRLEVRDFVRDHCHEVPNSCVLLNEARDGIPHDGQLVLRCSEANQHALHLHDTPKIVQTDR